tara:strand:- start:653 stop:1228 length:576 start_codon:yes stop_codon:yes gene_type:complete
MVGYLFFAAITQAADSNTVSSTVVTDKSVPTASAPSVVVNNSDVCKSAAAASVQTQVLGIATGITITDENCERLKLSRGLYVMGMKVAAVSTLCGDYRIFDAMWMAGTPCPYMGKIGDDAKTAWLDEGMGMIPEESAIKANIIATTLVTKKEIEKVKKKKDKLKPEKRPFDAEKVKLWATPLGILSLLLLL